MSLRVRCKGERDGQRICARGERRALRSGGLWGEDSQRFNHLAVPVKPILNHRHSQREQQDEGKDCHGNQEFVSSSHGGDYILLSVRQRI